MVEKGKLPWPVFTNVAKSGGCIILLRIEEIQEQLKILRSHPVIHAMVAVYIYAGLRREEALWLTDSYCAFHEFLNNLRTRIIVAHTTAMHASLI